MKSTSPLTTPETTPMSRTSTFSMVNPCREARWDELVRSHTSCSVFHSSAWAKVLHASYGHIPRYFMSLKDGSVSSLIPVMEVVSRLTSRRGVSLPFTDSCDPIISRPMEFEQLFADLTSTGRNLGWKYLELRVSTAFNLLGRPALEFYGHSLDLERTEDKIFSSMTQNLRNELRKAERSGADVVFSTDLLAVRHYYDLHCLTRRKHGLPPQPFNFFKNIHEQLLARDGGFVALAFAPNQSETTTRSESDCRASVLSRLWRNYPEVSSGKRPVAGAVFLNFGQRATYKFSASDETRNRLPLGKLALWRAVQWYRSRGFRSIDLGRSSLCNTGLRKYKKSWGANEYLIRNFRYQFAQREFVVRRDRVTGWYNRLLRRCPITLSRAIGAFLYRHLH
jgi:Acetyltransferase (GNAT) domain